MNMMRPVISWLSATVWLPCRREVWVVVVVVVVDDGVVVAVTVFCPFGHKSNTDYQKPEIRTSWKTFV